MIGFVPMLIALAILAALQQLVRCVRAARRVRAQRRRERLQAAQPFGLPTLTAPQQPQAVRRTPRVMNPPLPSQDDPPKKFDWDELKSFYGGGVLNARIYRDDTSDKSNGGAA